MCMQVNPQFYAFRWITLLLTQVGLAALCICTALAVSHSACVKALFQSTLCRTSAQPWQCCILCV